ncbi:MAG TPA: hypothetical protein VL576_03310 [Candidatus Paceibacterota bacterium]|jgi:hypothetical protein|nr:hypothetical protein [Candidatus Paceibacterota bacterium]
MDPDLEARLDNIEKMVSDNNKMLTRMRQVQRRAAYVRILYWVIGIILAIAAWYYVQPYFESVTNEYNTLTGKNTSGTTTPPGEIMNLINQYTGTK